MKALKVMDWFVGLNLFFNSWFVAVDLWWLFVHAVPQIPAVESSYFVAGYIFGEFLSIGFFYGWAFFVAIAWWLYARPRIVYEVYE